MSRPRTFPGRRYPAGLVTPGWITRHDLDRVLAKVTEHEPQLTLAA